MDNPERIKAAAEDVVDFFAGAVPSVNQPLLTRARVIQEAETILNRHFGESAPEQKGFTEFHARIIEQAIAEIDDNDARRGGHSLPLIASLAAMARSIREPVAPSVDTNADRDLDACEAQARDDDGRQYICDKISGHDGPHMDSSLRHPVTFAWTDPIKSADAPQEPTCAFVHKGAPVGTAPCGFRANDPIHDMGGDYFYKHAFVAESSVLPSKSERE